LELALGGKMLILKLILLFWIFMFITGVVIKTLVRIKKLDPTKKYVYKIKNPILQIVFALFIFSFVFSLALFSFVMLPVTILLSKLFPNYITASLKHGVTIKNVCSMKW
jgi:hypothetical protein